MAVDSFIDTAMSVEPVTREHDPAHTAIASAEAAELHGLHILRRDSANHRENYTRFLVIAREAEPWDPRRMWPRECRGNVPSPVFLVNPGGAR